MIKSSRFFEDDNENETNSLNLRINQNVKSLNTEVDDIKKLIKGVKNEIEFDKSSSKTADEYAHFDEMVLSLNSSLRKTLSTSERNSQDLVS